jgi:chromate reductase
MMAEKVLNVITLCGSLREGSYNAALTRMLPGLAPSGMKITPSPSWAKIPIYNADDETANGFPAAVTELADAIRAADGVIIVSPEYNWSIPGGLKNTIDWMSRLKDQPFIGKPVAIQSAARGLLGGSRMQYHLRQTLTMVEALTFGKPEVIVSFAPQKFHETTLELLDETAIGLIKTQLAGFEKFIRYHEKAKQAAGQ